MKNFQLKEWGNTGKQREMTKNEKRRHIRNIEQNIADKREKTNKDKAGFKKSLPTYETQYKMLKFQNEYISMEQTSGPLKRILSGQHLSYSEGS